MRMIGCMKSLNSRQAHPRVPDLARPEDITGPRDSFALSQESSEMLKILAKAFNIHINTYYKTGHQ